MQDSQLYQQILGLSDPWHVARVELQMAAQKVDVWVEHPKEASWNCPSCGQACPLHDHAAERSWRHLDTCQFQTHLHARVPRVNCPEHGVMNVSVPWGARNARFTMMMECWIIDLLLACQNIQSVCRLIGIHWETAAQLMQRAVARGLARKKSRIIKYVGVDEKAFRRGHHYVTVVSDLEQGAVEYVAEHRTSESLAGYYQQLAPPAREGIEAVAMDMHQPYVSATAAHLPAGKSKIVFDRFHIMKKATEALDHVRRNENFALSRRQDNTLARTRQMWLWSQENLPLKYQERLKRLQQLDLKTSKAWALKEHLRRLWDQTDGPTARTFFKHWHRWVERLKLTPMTRMARSLASRLDQIVSYCRHPITSAGCEGLNSKINSVQTRACGFRNLERMKIAIYFFCGKLSLHP